MTRRDQYQPACLGRWPGNDRVGKWLVSLIGGLHSDYIAQVAIVLD